MSKPNAILIGILVPFFALAVWGWMANEKRQKEYAIEAARPVPQFERLQLFTDPETGCQYVNRLGSSSAVTPRISPDGKSIMGCKEGKQ